MPVETIECQIVQAQLGRYLSGELFSNEAMRQLEDHIADCEICRQEVAVRRASLQALLGPSTKSMGRPDALIGALRESQAVSMKTIPTHAVVEQMVPDSASPSPKRFSKPVLYASALAIVLIAMSYIGNNPTSIFGNRAAETAAITPLIEEPAVDPAPAPTAEPLTLNEWSAMGIADWLPYDSTDATFLEPWQWMSLAEELPNEEVVAEVIPAEATMEDWELFGLSTALTPEPVAPAPRPFRPRVRAATPSKNTVRIYEPGQ